MLRLHLCTVSSRAPAWVEAGYDDYAARIASGLSLSLVAVRPAVRSAGALITALVAEEAARLRRAVPRGALVVALDEAGESWTTHELAAVLRGWQESASDVALLVGGADGLDPALRAEAARRWSLSPLTLPHALVRVVVAEQIYRAWSLLHGHPYHRGRCA